MGLSLSEYKRIKKTLGKDAADRAHASGETKTDDPQKPAIRPPSVPVAATYADRPSNRLTEIQALFARIAAVVQQALGAPPPAATLERICDEIHFGTNFFRTMAALEATGVIRREDAGGVTRYRINHAVGTLLGRNAEIAQSAIRAATNSQRPTP